MPFLFKINSFFQIFYFIDVTCHYTVILLSLFWQLKALQLYTTNIIISSYIRATGTYICNLKWFRSYCLRSWCLSRMLVHQIADCSGIRKCLCSDVIWALTTFISFGLYQDFGGSFKRKLWWCLCSFVSDILWQYWKRFKCSIETFMFSLIFQ